MQTVVVWFTEGQRLSAVWLGARAAHCLAAVQGCQMYASFSLFDTQNTSQVYTLTSQTNRRHCLFNAVHGLISPHLASPYPTFGMNVARDIQHLRQCMESDT